MSDPTNLAVVVYGARDVRVEQRPVPKPDAGQCLIRVSLGGICGSDLSYYKHGAVGDFKVVAPMILGHEVVGTVLEAAGTATQGSFVAVNPSSPCRTCDRCTQGRSNVCERPRFLGSASTTPHTDGGFAQFVVAKTENLVVVPSNIAEQSAVFAEPLAVAVHAINRAGGVKGARVLIVGAGPIGGILTAAARYLGADEIVSTDLDDSRLARAQQVGASTIVKVGVNEPQGLFDIVFEASGAPTAIADSLSRIRRGGRVVLVGLPHAAPIPMPMALAIPREADLLGSFRFNHNEFVTAVEMICNGLDLGPLHTHTHSASDSAAAFVQACAPDALKVQLSFP